MIDDLRGYSAPINKVLIIENKLNWCKECYGRRRVIISGKQEFCSCVKRFAQRAYKFAGGAEKTFTFDMVKTGIIKEVA